MDMKKSSYMPRLIDNVVERRLSVFGAVCIEGPKWCGKTWTSLEHSNSSYFVGDPDNNFRNRLLAEINPSKILIGKYPRLIDEWQEVPSLWDAVRFEVDKTSEKGKFILTGSSTPPTKGVLHSGAGRIDKIRMRPMTLFESNESCGSVSLSALFNKEFKTEIAKEKNDLEKLIHYVVRGGWPGSLNLEKEDSYLIPKSYINSLLTDEVLSFDGIKRSTSKIRALLRSLARNESTLASNRTIVKDIKEMDDESVSTESLRTYVDILERMFILENQNSYAPNIKSKARVAKSAKRHLVDPSLAVALLNLTPKMLYENLDYFGFLFESLVYRDLNIYSEVNDYKTFHYRNLSKKEEIDIIVQTKEGDYGAFEVKLGLNQIDEAAKGLIGFKNSFENQKDKPKILCIICGVCDIAYKREDGVFVIPINMLKP